MPKRSVFCIVPSFAQAERIVTALKAADFANDDISALLPADATTRNLSSVPNQETHAVLIAGHNTADVVASPLASIAGIGPFSLPSRDPLIGGGPIVAALGGATEDGVAAGLVVLGLPASAARRYDAMITAGKILISVPAADEVAFARAREIFTQNGADDVSVTDEPPTPIITPADKRTPPAAAVPSSVAYSTKS